MGVDLSLPLPSGRSDCTPHPDAPTRTREMQRNEALSAWRHTPRSWCQQCPLATATANRRGPTAQAGDASEPLTEATMVCTGMGTSARRHTGWPPGSLQQQNNNADSGGSNATSSTAGSQQPLIKRPFPTATSSISSGAGKGTKTTRNTCRFAGWFPRPRRAEDAAPVPGMRGGQRRGDGHGVGAQSAREHRHCAAAGGLQSCAFLGRKGNKRYTWARNQIAGSKDENFKRAVSGVAENLIRRGERKG